jgi:cellulose biosynthesis protein BcsQ
VIFTFYSYKGGVGRSMALASVGDVLARRGLRVLMIDFDLEAPGLEEYFPVERGEFRSRPGLLDLLLAYKQVMSREPGDDSPGVFEQVQERFVQPIYPCRSPKGHRWQRSSRGRG